MQTLRQRQAPRAVASAGRYFASPSLMLPPHDSLAAEIESLGRDSFADDQRWVHACRRGLTLPAHLDRIEVSSYCRAGCAFKLEVRFSAEFHSRHFYSAAIVVTAFRAL